MLASLFRTTHTGKPPLRIGLLLNTPVLPRCSAEVIDHILHSDFARLELVILKADEQQQASGPKRSLARKLLGTVLDRTRRRRLLFTLYQRWDSKRAAGCEDPQTPVDCSERLQQVDTIRVTPITKRFVHRFPKDAVERIRAKNLDVLIRFGFNILRGEILTAARYGVWSYHHGDNDRYRGGPAYFWEVYEGAPISGAILQVLTEELDAGKVLCKGLFATHPGFSHTLNRLQPYWGATTFMIQKLYELHQNGWEHLERNALAPAPYRGRKKIYTAPTNWEMLRWLGPLLIRKTARRLRRPSDISHWRLAIRTQGQSVLNSGSAPELAGFQWIESPPGHFYADPFLIEHLGKPWAFFEDFDYTAQRGTIACAEILGDGSLSKPASVLERPYHLSYPCIFRDHGTLYMIPETRANRTIELYRCLRFPRRWELEKVLFTGDAVDTTVWIEDGAYWFFVTLVEPRGHAKQLWLFYADALTGEWTPHPANPVSMDVRNCRGAGAIFRHEGKLYRPSQDCGTNYGRSFTLNEIVTLDKRCYQERPGITVAPSWAKGLVGTHTYSRAGAIEIIDGCTPLPRRRVLGRGQAEGQEQLEAISGNSGGTKRKTSKTAVG